MKKTKTLAEQFKDIRNAYRDALNKMWETDGYWLDEDMWWFEVSDCVIGITEVRELVDRKVDFDTFIEWYEYDAQIHYGQELGQKGGRKDRSSHLVKRLSGKRESTERNKGCLGKGILGIL